MLAPATMRGQSAAKRRSRAGTAEVTPCSVSSRFIRVRPRLSHLLHRIPTRHVSWLDLMRSQRLTFVRSGEKRAFCLAALAEPMVKAVSRFFAAVMLSVALTLSASSVLAQINPFRGNRAEPALTGTDLDLLGASVARLNQNPKVAVGSKEEWTNPATGSHGTSIVTRVFTSSQRPCHTLHHEFFPFG